MASEQPNKRPRLEGEASGSTSNSSAPDAVSLHDIVATMSSELLRRIVVDAAMLHPSIASRLEDEAKASKRTRGREESSDPTTVPTSYRDYFGPYNERVTEIFAQGPDSRPQRMYAAEKYLPSSEIKEMFQTMEHSAHERAVYEVKRSALENMRKILTTIMTADSVIAPETRRMTQNMECHFLVVLRNLKKEDTKYLSEDFDGKWRDRLHELQTLAEGTNLFPKLKKAVGIFDAAAVASASYSADDCELSAVEEPIEEVLSDSDDEPVFLGVVEPDSMPAPTTSLSTPYEARANRVPDIDFDHFREQALSRIENERSYGNNHSRMSLDTAMEIADEIGFIFRNIARQTREEASYYTKFSAIDTMKQILWILTDSGECSFERTVAQYTRDLEDHVQAVLTRFSTAELVRLRQEYNGQWFDKLIDICESAEYQDFCHDLSACVDYIEQRSNPAIPLR